MKEPDGHSRMRQLRELFEEATDLPKAEREAFIEKACAENPKFRERLTAMLRDWESGASLFDSVCEEAIWPALESLRKDPGKLSNYMEASDDEDAAAADSLVGKQVSHFRIQETIGSGGMGMVYKAHDELLERTVALKFLPPAMGVEASARERFIHEAKTASALDHANIATIHEIGETPDGQTFITMAYYPGSTLKERLDKGALPQEEALDFAIQLVSALEQAHRSGVIHRDVKPANLQITEDGVLKLLDFGLAKLSSATGYTQVGEMIGTVAYMSPEQARGEPVDHRTDIWSVGVVLYEMLAGERPFEGDNVQSVMHAILEKDPFAGLNQKKPKISIEGSLKTIIRTCLAKNPDERYTSASELLADLRRVRQGEVAWGKPASLKRRLFTAGKVVALLAVVGLLVFVAEKWIHLEKSTAGEEAGAGFTRILVSPFKDDLGAFGGIYWADYDGDDYPDLFVTGITPRLFHNEGNGSFTRVTDGGLADRLETDKGGSWGAAWVDFENDGDLDVYVTYFSNKEADADRFFLNDGDGTFTQVEADWIPKDARTSASWGDFDNDGLVDLFAANIHEDGGKVFHHLTDGNMVPVESYIGYSLGCDWSDYDLDGDVDLFCGGRPELIFRNDGEGVFIRVTEEALPGAPARWHPNFCVSTADYDNDGDPDLALANESFNQLFRNDREAGWVALDGNPISQLGGASCTWADYDNDGWLDLLILPQRQLFHNEGDGTFTKIEGNPLTDGTGRNAFAAWADYDNDGDLDVVLNDGLRHGGTPTVPARPLALYRNDGNANHWLMLKLVGTESNRSAIGAKVYLEATLNGTFLRQLREVKSASGQISQSDMRVHFGLGDATTVDRVTVHWPSGLVEEWTGLAADQFLTLVEGQSAL